MEEPEDDVVLTDWPPPSETELKYYTKEFPYRPPKVPYGYPHHLMDGRACVIIDEQGVEHIECKNGCLPLRDRPEGWMEWQRTMWEVNGVVVFPKHPEPESIAEVLALTREKVPTVKIVPSGVNDKKTIQRVQMRELVNKFEEGD